jgi:hypothetical protein
MGTEFGGGMATPKEVVGPDMASVDALETAKPTFDRLNLADSA